MKLLREHEWGPSVITRLKWKRFSWEAEQREFWRKSLFELLLDGFNIISPDWKGMGMRIGRIPRKAAGFCKETAIKVQPFLSTYRKLVSELLSKISNSLYKMAYRTCMQPTNIFLIHFQSPLDYLWYLVLCKCYETVCYTKCLGNNNKKYISTISLP